MNVSSFCFASNLVQRLDEQHQQQGSQRGQPGSGLRGASWLERGRHVSGSGRKRALWSLLESLWSLSGVSFQVVSWFQTFVVGIFSVLKDLRPLRQKPSPKMFWTQWIPVTTILTRDSVGLWFYWNHWLPAIGYNGNWMPWVNEGPVRQSD